MKIILLATGCFAAAFFLLICKVAVASVKEMLNPDSMFVEPIEDITNTSDTTLKKVFNETNTWAQYHGFELMVYTHFVSQTNGKTIHCIFWSNKNQTLVFALYYAEGTTHFDFATKFEHAQGLTTSSSKDGGTLPPLPKDFTQHFPGLTLNETWEQHKEAEHFLQAKYGFTKVPFVRDILSEVKESISKQAKYITTLFLWQLRGPYWFFIRKHLVANKNVADQ